MKDEISRVQVGSFKMKLLRLDRMNSNSEEINLNGKIKLGKDWSLTKIYHKRRFGLKNVMPKI